MRRTSLAMADKFRDIVARVGAVFREQRKIDAQRALQRYHHLLARPGETLPLNEIICSGSKMTFRDMPTDLMRASAPSARRPARSFNIVAIALTMVLVALQLLGLALLERSHAHAMQMSFQGEPAACTDSPDAAVPQIPYD